MTVEQIKQDISNGIPTELPSKKVYELDINHAPKRKDILSKIEKQLALRNALRYFPKSQHEELAIEFSQELKKRQNIMSVF